MGYKTGPVWVSPSFSTCTHPANIAWSTWARFFMSRTSFDVESAHWPFWMGLMKRFRNSRSEPRRLFLMKFTMQWSGKEKTQPFQISQLKWHIKVRGKFSGQVVQAYTQSDYFGAGCLSAPPSSSSLLHLRLWKSRTRCCAGCDPRRTPQSLDLERQNGACGNTAGFKLGLDGATPLRSNLDQPVWSLTASSTPHCWSSRPVTGLGTAHTPLS